VLAVDEAPGKDRRQLDFTTLRGDIANDLSCRDFTIDAMAVRLEDIVSAASGASPEGQGGISLRADMLVDPCGGLDDLRRGVIRAVREDVFTADAVRVLRAARLSAELGFRIDAPTEELMRRDGRLVGGIPGERVREELLRALAVPGAGRLLSYLDELGVLTVIIPELASARGVEQPWVHFWDVLNHSLQTVAAAEFLLGEGEWAYGTGEMLSCLPWSEEMRQYFAQEVSSGSTRLTLLKLAALLHDVAKPQTKTVTEDGRARFLGHTEQGAEVAAAILARLRFSAREIKLVQTMVKYHLRPGQMSSYETPSRRAVYRYFRDSAGAGIDILYLSLADHAAARGPMLDMAQWRRHAQLVDYVISQQAAMEGGEKPSRLIDGHDLINIFGMQPGPRMGELLEAVREARAAGEIDSREAALAWVREWLSRTGDKA